jgi:hypothetical protein
MQNYHKAEQCVCLMEWVCAKLPVFRPLRLLVYMYLIAGNAIVSLERKCQSARQKKDQQSKHALNKPFACVLLLSARRCLLRARSINSSSSSSLYIFALVYKSFWRRRKGTMNMLSAAYRTGRNRQCFIIFLSLSLSFPSAELAR